MPPQLQDATAWDVTIQTPPAMPLQIVGIEHRPTHADFSFDHAMTPGAMYLLRQGDVALPFKGYESPQLASRRLKLVALLPKYAQVADTSGEQRDLFACMQDVVDHLAMRIEVMNLAANISTSASAHLTLMLSELGNPFPCISSGSEARRLIPMLGHLYQQKGTARGIKNVVRVFLGLELLDIRGRQLTSTSPRSDHYTFDMIFARQLSPNESSRVRAIVHHMKPAHTHLGNILTNQANFVPIETAARSYIH